MLGGWGSMGAVWCPQGGLELLPVLRGGPCADGHVNRSRNGSRNRWFLSSTVPRQLISCRDPPGPTPPRPVVRAEGDRLEGALGEPPGEAVSHPGLCCGRRGKMAAKLLFLLLIMRGTAERSSRVRVQGWAEVALGAVGDLGHVPVGEPSLSPLSPPAFPVPAQITRVTTHLFPSHGSPQHLHHAAGAEGLLEWSWSGPGVLGEP